MAIDEADQDLEDEQAYVRVLQQREGQERVQEGAGQSRQHVRALEAACHLDSRRTSAFARSVQGVVFTASRGRTCLRDFSSMT